MSISELTKFGRRATAMGRPMSENGHSANPQQRVPAHHMRPINYMLTAFHENNRT